MKRKNIIFIFCLSLIFISVGSFCLTYYCPRNGHDYIDIFDLNQNFNDNYISTINKEPGQDFTILNLADLQISDFDNIKTRPTIHKLIDELVDRTKPDLITLTGDQVWCDETKNSLKAEIRWLESYNIPWAPVFGNHDLEGTARANYQCDLYEKAEHCLFKRGPSNLGSLGNYVINIAEDNHIYKTLYMLNLGTLDDFTDEQINFIKWNADGIKKMNNNIYPSSMSFFHKAIYKFNDAYNAYLNDPSIALTDIYRHNYIADKDAGVSFYEAAKIINIKDIICGHQHANMGTILYDDVKFTFALKTGDMCFVYEDKNNPHLFVCGGTSILLKDDETIYTPNYVSENYRVKSLK